MRRLIVDLKNVLSEVVKRTPYNSLLFSGGLDTSILASLNPKISAITVSLESNAEDIPYSVRLARLLNIKHLLKKISIDEAIEGIPKVIKILKSFDPAIPNDLAVYFGLEFAKNLGLDKVATGDGSDELFCGYSYMREIDDLENYIQRISKNMSFNSNRIGKSFGIKIVQPFMDKEVLDFALQIPVDLKIKRYKGKTFGKWILRKAFEDILPKEIIWQKKRPIEYGSGFNRLRKIISERISDEEFKGDSSNVKFISKEHFYYYKIYREVIGEIPKPKGNQRPCLGCGGGIKMDSFHCKICGHVLDWRTG